MTTRRQIVIALGAGALVAPFASFAQPKPAKVPRIGFLGQASAAALASRVGSLRAGLRELGYVEGKNIAIEIRGTEKYERLGDLAAELVRLKVDVLVTQGTPSAFAAKRATTTIPIVMPGVADPVASGLVASLARPGGNITGFTYFVDELNAKRLELLKETFPRITRIAVLSNPDNPATGPMLKAMGLAAKSLKLSLEHFDVRAPDDIESAFAAMGAKKIDAVAVVDDSILNINAKGIADLAAQRRLPSIGIPELANAGGLIGYGINILEMYRRAALLVDKILKGAKPSELPIERPTTFEMVINLKTAKALGLTIPPPLLLRADRVIE